MSPNNTQRCAVCGGLYSFYHNTIEHNATCPLGGEGQKISSLEAARFNRADKPAQLNPRSALVAALEWFDAEVAAGRPVTHVVVITGRDSPKHPGASGTRFFQAGTYRHHAQMGLCLEGMEMMRDSGSDG